MTTGRLRALFAAEGIAFGLSMPFLVPLLDDRGLDAAAIGLALGATGMTSGPLGHASPWIMLPATELDT